MIEKLEQVPANGDYRDKINELISEINTLLGNDTKKADKKGQKKGE